MRVLLAGVGYDNLRDFSVGPIAMTHLARQKWPPGVDIDDLSYGAIHVYHQLLVENRRYDRVVLVGAVRRGRPAGTIWVVHSPTCLPPPDEVQRRIGEAVAGVIDLEHLVVIGQYLGLWPRDLRVVEVEPQIEAFGPDLSPTLAAALDEVLWWARYEALEGWAEDWLDEWTSRRDARVTESRDPDRPRSDR